MSLQPGQRLGAYEVIAAIGAGGMGEVYRARDTKLNRDVALKVLPDIFAADPDRLARFQREAELLAALSHPHIAGIHGLEDSTSTKALVLEFVDGPTLADRIAQGPMPVDEALAIARQIADALEAAHEAGVIHRDLKPANIKLRPDGTVKVLDFGLAKLQAGAGSSSTLSPLSMSPTVTSPAMMTGIGVILGTAAYMAPEQARGKSVDKRADIWGFGCVLYEMLTGVRPFDGEDATLLVANIVKADPAWAPLPDDTPAAVRVVLRRCLQKDPKQRLRDIGDVRLALDGAFAATPDERPAAFPVAEPSRFRRSLPWVAGLMAGIVITGAATWAVLGGDRRTPAPLKRFAIRLPDATLLPAGAGTLVAISPDGQTLIYRASQNGIFRLYRRTLGQFEASPIGDESAGESPFFSPDSQWLAFQIGNTLKKVSALGGGVSQTVAEVPPARGGTWGDDDTIIVGVRDAGLMRVPAAGGAPVTIAAPEAGRQLWYPQIVPGGRAVLFTSSEQTPDTGELQILDLETMERRALLPGSAGRVLPTGHLVFVRGATLWAAAFDMGALAVIGNPVPVLEGIRVEAGGAVQFAVAEDGSLAYLPGGSGVAEPRRLVWIDRAGREEPIGAPPRTYGYPRISPDGRRLALDVRDQQNDVWIWDFARTTLTRLTLDPTVDQYPTWSRDGRRVIFSSAREKGPLMLFSQAADGTGATVRVAMDAKNLDQAVMSPDGARVVVHSFLPGAGEDIAAISMEGEPRVEPLLNTNFTERNADLSPDGRWIAYQSNDSGIFEIYVRPFPQVDSGRWQISTGGGLTPLWARDGRELFFLSNDRSMLMHVPIDGRAGFSAGNTTGLVNVSAYATAVQGRSYDVSPDGRRFLMIKNEDAQSSAEIHVVLNWFEELKRLVPID